MSDNGDLAGSSGGFRGYGSVAWVSHIRADKRASLPSPKVDGFRIGTTVAVAVIRGATWFAPAGGITVGGTAGGLESTKYATIWTCAQTYQ